MRYVYGPNLWVLSPLRGQSWSLDSSKRSIANTFVVPKSGTINRVIIGGVVSVVGSPPAYNVGLVTVDSNGNPSTTPYGGSAVASVTFSSTGLTVVTLPTAATATAGDRAAVRVWPGSTAPSTSNYVTIELQQIQPMRMDVSRKQTDTSLTTFTTVTGDVFSVPLYNDDYVPYVVGFNGHLPGVTSGSESGARVTPPVSLSCQGLAAAIWPGSASATITIRLYDSSNSVLGSGTFQWSSINGSIAVTRTWFYVYFSSPVSILAEQTYRIALTTNSTTAAMEVMSWRHQGIAALKAACGPLVDRWVATSRTGTNPWSDDTNEMPLVGFLVDSLPMGGSGGLVQSGYIG